MIFKKIYEIAEFYGDSILLDKHLYDAVEGKHCIWIPELEIKIPWVFNGKIESRKQWDLGINADELKRQVFNDDSSGWEISTLCSIEEEYYLFEMFSTQGISPTVDGFIYIKNMISQYNRPIFHCDSMGVIGFYIQDANKLEPGNYTFELFKKLFLDTEMVTATKGAIGDLLKDDNIVNGYLIDIRRTIWDMIQPNDDYMRIYLTNDCYKPDREDLKKKILSLGQFPYGQRKKAYQTYWLGDHYEDGTRQVIYRFDQMKIDKELKGKTIVDLGSQLGGICTECYLRGARHITGIEYEADYVECARDLARYNHHQINYQCMNLKHVDIIISYLNLYYQQLPIDIVFLLSMYKHIGSYGFKILKGLNFWRVAYIESNNCPGGYNAGQARQMESDMNGYFKGNYKIDRIGMTEDRSPRCLWKITKND